MTKNLYSPNETNGHHKKTLFGSLSPNLNEPLHSFSSVIKKTKRKKCITILELAFLSNLTATLQISALHVS